MHPALHIVTVIGAVVIALPATAACLYLFVLTCLSFRASRPRPSSRTLFFDVIVPAHNEASGIEKTISSLQQLDWPTDRYRVVVVADNCTDETASIARAAGACVLERQDSTRAGKGYALAHAFSWSRSSGLASALVVVDADSVVSANLLESFAARIEAGESAVQAHYGVLNAMQTWRTRLMAIAFGCFHRVRSCARERMGLSCGIRGNGWCVTHALLEEVPYSSFSLTEDIEFGIELGLAGHRVAYSDESYVNGEMAATEGAARSQRQRWEGGRLQLIRKKVPALLRAAVVRPSRVCLDLAFDLLLPPLSYVVLNVAGVLALSFVGPDSLRAAWLPIGLADLAALVIYVFRGWMLSGTGLAGMADLLRVPAFLVWKIVIILVQPKPRAWIRTQRER